MFSSGRSQRSASSSHGAYVRPAQTRSTGSLPTAATFSASKSPYGSASRSRSGWFPGFGGGSKSSSSSYYKRRPRDGYIQGLIAKIRRILRDLYNYIRRNPVKALLPILTVLVSSGALAALAGRFGLKLPRTIMGLMGAGQSVKGGYDAWYGSQHREEHDGGWGGGAGGVLKGAVKVASAFM